jgi:Inner membrane protein YgaP-like, transmembrane domain
MMANVGNIDRVLRFVVGAALLLVLMVPQLGGMFESWGQWKFAVAAVGFVLLATAAFRICPAYMLFGIRTCRTP